jgi:hypothetical protein
MTSALTMSTFSGKRLLSDPKFLVIHIIRSLFDGEGSEEADEDNLFTNRLPIKPLAPVTRTFMLSLSAEL